MIDCRDGAGQVLALLAYPNESENKKRARFCDAAVAEYARWLKAMLPRATQPEVNYAYRNALKMPAQQSQNTLRVGMRRVGWRLAAAILVQRQLVLTRPGLKFVVGSVDSLNDLRIIGAEPTELAPSMSTVIEITAPHIARMIAVGDPGPRGIKNIQDRIVRLSLPVAHLSHALLIYLQRKFVAGASNETCAPSDHWSSYLVRNPAWIEDVVPAAMTARDMIWLHGRENNLIFQFDAMIPVALIRTATSPAPRP